VEGDSIRITFKSQKITVAANDYEISDATGRVFYTEIRQTMRGTDSAALASVCTEGRLAELDAGNIPTDLTNIETDTQDIQSRLPAALVSGRMSSDAVAISGSTVAADNVEANIGDLDAAISTRATPAQVNTEVDNALNTAIPGTPTADSINERIKAIDDKLPTGNISDFDESTDEVTLADDSLTAAKIATDAGTEIANAILDQSNGIETGLTLRQAQRLIAAAAAGKLSGAATTTILVRNAVADTKNRITATVDVDGNRAAVTTDVT
jgi:hypothetical protein